MKTGDAGVDGLIALLGQRDAAGLSDAVEYGQDLILIEFASASAPEA